MMTMTAYNNDNEVKDLEKNGIEATDLTASNIVGDSPTVTVNNDVEVEGGSGPDDLSEASASGNRYHSQDASSHGHGRNGWMTIVSILGLGSLALAAAVAYSVATTKGFELFNKSNPLSSNGAIVTSLQVDGTDKSSNKKSKQLKETSRSLKKKKVLKCGDVVMNRKVSLKKDLTCGATDAGVINGVPNAALTLDGPDAVLKCKGKSNKVKIVQDEGEGDASTCEALDGYTDNLETDSEKVEAIKEGCGLPFLYGVKLLNGAKAVGCDIENFLVGAYVGQGAKELSDVTVLGNTYGVVVETNTTVNIADITANENGRLGILASNDGTSIFVKEYTPGGSIELQEITASVNGGNGIEIQGGSDISVKSAVVNGNVAAGIYIKNSDKIDLKNVKAEGNFHGIIIYDSREVDLEEIDANSNSHSGISISGISVCDNIYLKNIRANDNIHVGIGFSSGGGKCSHTLENVEANNNGDAGISAIGSFLEMSWKGRISLDGNKGNGLRLFGFDIAGTITISGELTVDNNENDGILLKVDSDATISIAEGASFSACGSGRSDIFAMSAHTSFTVAMEGDGTCAVGTASGTVTLPSQCGRTCPDLDRFF